MSSPDAEIKEGFITCVVALLIFAALLFWLTFRNGVYS